MTDIVKIPRKIQDILNKYKPKEILEAIELYKNMKREDLFLQIIRKTCKFKKKSRKYYQEV